MWRWLYTELRSAIIDGRLKSGARLPSTRNLAAQYGLARGTVVAAFQQLQAEGFVSSEVGAGIFVVPGLQYSLTVRAAWCKALLRSPLFSVRCASFQFFEIERACIGVQPLPQSVAFNRALGRQLASERSDQRLIRPQKPRGQLVPGMRKGIGFCHCFGDTPINRSLPRVKRTRHVGYELLAQLIRNRITDCLVDNRSHVDEGERSA